MNSVSDSSEHMESPGNFKVLGAWFCLSPLRRCKMNQEIVGKMKKIILRGLVFLAGISMAAGAAAQTLTVNDQTKLQRRGKM